MIIIVEGCDGGGKSTLTAQLMKRFKLQYHHEGPPPADMSSLEHYGSILQAYREKNVVFDRFALGERVYGPIYRGFDTLGESGWRVFHRLITASATFQIMCLPKYEVCRKAWASGRDEMIRDEPTFKKTYDGFKELASTQNHIYDWTHEGAFERLCIRIEDWYATHRPLPFGVIGSPNASYLLVGDKGSNPNSKTTDLAFFGTSGSSGYLTEALDRAGYVESELMFVNAHRHDGLNGSWPIPSKIIALGSAASHECRSRTLAHTKIPHPQYWKRFHSSDVNGYVELLRGCR